MLIVFVETRINEKLRVKRMRNTKKTGVEYAGHALTKDKRSHSRTISIQERYIFPMSKQIQYNCRN